MRVQVCSSAPALHGQQKRQRRQLNQPHCACRCADAAGRHCQSSATAQAQGTPKSTVLSGQIQQQATALAPVKPHWLLSKVRHASTDRGPATHSSPGATVRNAPRGGRRLPAQCNVSSMHAHTLYGLCGDLARSHPCRSTAATKGRPGPPKPPITATDRPIT